MSKRNRPWKCVTCGALMHRELSLAEWARRHPGKLVVHGCGECRALHTETSRGRLRLLTAGERFMAEMEAPAAMERMRTAVYKPLEPGEVRGTLYLEGKPAN